MVLWDGETIIELFFSYGECLTFSLPREAAFFIGILIVFFSFLL